MQNRPVGRLRLAIHAAWQALVEFARSNHLTYASSIAYFALLSLFPCLLLALGLLGAATASDGDRDAVVAVMQHYLPLQFQFITAQIDVLRELRWSLGLAGTVLVTWAALGVFQAVTTAVNAAWGVRDRHGVLRQTLVSAALLVVAALLLLVALALVSARGVVGAGWFADLLAGQPALRELADLPLVQWLTGLVSAWTAAVLVVVVAGLIFRFVPAAPVRMREAWPGALLTGILWQAALLAFSAFLDDLGRLSVHGSIATVIAFLLWVYVQAAILLYGAGFTAAYARGLAAAEGSAGSPR